MRLLWRARSNPLAWWWGLLTLASSVNIALWLVLYRQFYAQPVGSLEHATGIQLMLILCAAYVFGCAFRSILPRADVQRICLFDTWLSSVVIGRSVATVAEVCFAAQWALVLHQLGGMADVDIILNVAWLIVPPIIVAQCCSWYGVLTTNYLANAIENSIWAVVFLMVGLAVCRLLPEFEGLVRLGLVVAIVGIAAYLAFLITIDVPMYLSRWQDGLADGTKFWVLSKVSATPARDGSSRTTLRSGRMRLPGCRSISLRRSGRASRFALFTRSGIIFPGIAPNLLPVF